MKTVTIIANDGVFQPNCRNMLVIAWSTWSNLLFMYWTKRRQEAPLQPRSYAIKFPKGTGLMHAPVAFFIFFPFSSVLRHKQRPFSEQRYVPRDPERVGKRCLDGLAWLRLAWLSLARSPPSSSARALRLGQQHQQHADPQKQPSDSRSLSLRVGEERRREPAV